MIAINRIWLNRALTPSERADASCSDWPEIPVSTFRSPVIEPDECHVPATWDELQSMPIANLASLGLKTEVIGYLEAAGVFFYGQLPQTVGELLQLRGFVRRKTVRKFARSHIRQLLDVLEKLKGLIERGRAA